jgi:hypothetical protein
MREPLIPDPNADRQLKAFKHLTKTPRVYSKTPSWIDPTAAAGMDHF